MNPESEPDGERGRVSTETKAESESPAPPSGEGSAVSTVSILAEAYCRRVWEANSVMAGGGPSAREGGK